MEGGHRATQQPTKQEGRDGQQERDMQAEGFGKAERAADKRSSRREQQQKQRFFVAGCVVVCDIFYSFLIYMLGNCYVLVGWVKKELVFAGTKFLQKGISGKLDLEKKEHGKEFNFFC
jgi:hypothetical protein